MLSEAYSALLPEITATNGPFWQGCAQGELRLQVCDACGTFRFPDAPVCPRCLHDSFTWKKTSGTGRLWSWIRIHQRYLAAYADEIPYVVAFVQLSEGPFLITHLVDGPPDSWLDQPVRAVFEPDAAGRSVLKFAVDELQEQR
ncbi:Zn-ribbon domain-containing OB-fold protein [Nocardia jiangxiensis]|uniref:Zn-ribbon domain-containing OB-fold protein n=1 Tax=Nocardia jiangxiensis TaxID=282685 RepID=A0ABW6SE35_9NOCA|nr:OB-fold domain-containing protein [Nocardia jiangxiensis]